MGDPNMNKKTSERVKILSYKLIKPLSKIPDHPRSYKLSLIDQLAPPDWMTALYFYRAVENLDAEIVAGRLEQLEKSLSESLSCYYPLAGRLAADLLSVDCQDQGVLFMVAKVDCQLNQFLDESREDFDLLKSLAPEWRVGDQDSLFEALVRVQISIFDCGGIALAKETHHTVADGFTAFTFLNLWAAINRCGNTEAKSPNFDSAAISPALEISTMNNARPLVDPHAKFVAKRLLFNGAAIARLKDQVMARALGMDGPPSKVEVVAAFIWSGLIRAAQARHGYLRPSMICFPVNLRGKTALRVPENAFGNIYILVPIKFMADESKMELHFFVLLIRDTIRRTLQECSTASYSELSSMNVRAHNEVKEWSGKDEVEVRVASSLCRFPLYEADFGWGKPSLVHPIRFPFELFFMMDTKCGTGIDVHLSLNEIEMQKLELDPYMEPFIAPKKSNLE